MTDDSSDDQAIVDINDRVVQETTSAVEKWVFGAFVVVIVCAFILPLIIAVLSHGFILSNIPPAGGWDWLLAWIVAFALAYLSIPVIFTLARITLVLVVVTADWLMS